MTAERRHFDKQNDKHRIDSRLELTRTEISPYGEYLLALRLESELSDLRAANANPYSKRKRF
ncbi:MAG: hypothetical protein J6B77_03765, partial [Clostridia bacterium]|nr:hypothetical protein [Clostridia bacterium]